MGIFAFAAIICAVMALAADIRFATEMLLKTSGFPAVWPEEWQRRAVSRHVYFRDFGLLVPGIAGMFAWALW